MSAEPALPEERRRAHLPPKSYAGAVEEPAVNGANGVSKANDVNAAGDMEEETEKTASVLRIVDTGAPEETERAEKPELERQQSQQEYSATVSLRKYGFGIIIYDS